MGYYFVSIRKSPKQRSLEYFGSSENKVLPRNKSFIEIGKKMKKKLIKLNELENFKNYFLIFDRNQYPQKA